MNKKQRDYPARIVAAVLGISLDEFSDRLPRFLARGFPPADPDTGNYDVESVHRWMALRHRHLWPDLFASASPSHRSGADMIAEPNPVVADRIQAIRSGSGNHARQNTILRRKKR